MLSVKAKVIKVGDTFTLDDGVTWHELSEVESARCYDGEVAILFTTMKSERLWAFDDDDVVVRI